MKKIISIPASLMRAAKNDCFSRDIPLANKLFFCKNPETFEFCGKYTIPGNDSFATMEIINLLHLGVLYYVSLPINYNNYCFHLQLQEADEFDLIYSVKYAKENTTYFVRNGDDVSGPYYFKVNADVNQIKAALKNKILYVPCKTQNFEKLTTSITA